MQISISTRHGSLSEASREKLAAKAEKLTRFFDRVTAIEMTVDLKDQQKPKVDLLVSVEHLQDLVAHEQAESLLSAVESAVQKIEQQLRKHKERIHERSRDPDARRHEPPIAVDDNADENEE
ncbi:MAG: ribosome-associated translation inhibitor RaiA [Pirellulales bacterium]|nr:ribosome-associated translation inhibitor RaiA [Pirellulales bacterium]